MQAKLTRYTVEKNIILGEMNLTYHIFFGTSEVQEFLMPVFITIDKLKQNIKSYNEPLCEYITKIRSEIHGYGPKHDKVHDILVEENFDFDTHLAKYVEMLTPEYIQMHRDWCEKLKNLPKDDNKKIKETYNKMNESMTPEVNDYCLDLNNFTDELDKTIHELTYKYFPSLFEKGEKHVQAYKSVLCNTVLSFKQDIDQIMHDKFRLHFEESYNREQERKKKS